MASYTENLNLRKIDGTDAPPDITVLNENWEILDQTVENKMNKHLLQYDGDIKENGVRLTFPVLYNMLLTEPDFVVLVNDGEALHPNVVNNNEIVFVSVDPDNTGLTGRKVTMTNDGFSTVTLEEVTTVPSSRKINNKELSSDVNLTASDVGALPSNRVILNGVDVKTISQSGFYYILNGTNLPTGSVAFGFLDVYAYPNNNNYRFIRWQNTGTSGASTNKITYYDRMIDGVWDGWSTMYLPLSGGSLSGNLDVVGGISTYANKLFFKDSNHNVKLQFYSYGDGKNGIDVYDRNSNKVRGITILDNTLQANKGRMINVSEYDNGWKEYNLFGEHNKPRGTYVGNGSATQRTIATNALEFGNAVLIYSNNGYALITKTSGLIGNASSITPIAYETAHINNNTSIIIASTNIILNANGVTYNYVVL